MIDRDSPLPIYYQLQQLLKAQIESDALEAGDRLPTEQELCTQYHISRAPVRQALQALTQEGYIHRRAGVGTFVAKRCPAPAEQRVTLRFLAYDVRWAALLERAVQHWNATHPGRNIRLEVIIPSQAEFHQTLCASVGSDNDPDIVSIDYVWVVRYARLGYLLDLDTLDHSFATQVKAELEPPVLRNNTIKGRLYGLPIQADVTGFWYRRDWFEAEGLNPPETWDEWLALLEYFSQDNIKARYGHRWPIAFPVSTTTGEATLNLLLPFIWAAGGTLLDEEGHFTTDERPIFQALTFLHQIVQERHYLPDAVTSFRWWDIPHLLAQDKVPMTLGGTYEWAAISEEAGGERDAVTRHLGFVPIPRPNMSSAPVASLGGTTWAIMRHSQHRELSLEILKLAMEPQAMLNFCERELQISSLRPLNQQLMVGDKQQWMQTVIPLLAAARPRPMLENYVQISSFVQRMFEMVLVEDVPIATAIQQTKRTLELLAG
ncbi:MAG: extracellular solute-binding protein [Chloroflexota bacterium]|nr:extracellular solute-binding protein [Chloroflexota bacterium]